MNHRWVKLPAAIGLMAMSLAGSLLLVVVDQLGWIPLAGTAGPLLAKIDFNETLLHGMLGALLFAGALHIDLSDLRDELAAVVSLAIGGTILSCFLVAGAFYGITRILEMPIDFGHCLLFGALISPTDPVAVLGVLKTAGVPKRLETQIAGESLLNDGVGVVVFVTVLRIVTEGHASVGGVALLFLRETVGGALFGLASGYATYRLLRSIDHYQTEVMLTLGLVLGGYAFAQWIHVSAPIAAVTAGLIIGNQGRSSAMSDVTRDHLDKFWLLIDEILNALLFVLVGFEVMRISIHWLGLLAGVMAIGAVLLARFASVGATLRLLARFRTSTPGESAILSWGGLRGGISVALALSIPATPSRDAIVSTTYIVVVFSVLVQGLTLERFARHFGAPRPAAA